MKKSVFLLSTTLVLSLATLTAPAQAWKSYADIDAMQSRYAMARANGPMLQYGKDALAKANTAMMLAQKNRRNSEKRMHYVALAGTQLDIAAVQARQSVVQSEIVALKERQITVRLDARDRQIVDAKQETAVANAQTAVANADRDIAEQRVASMAEQLKSYDVKLNASGATLVLRDVLFESGSATLRAGAEQRLSPLSRYVVANPAVRLRIEGHTDSVGSDGSNRQLSEDRANAVANQLAMTGIERSRIETIGYGESKPVASNVTSSGREENRRVEVTLTGTTALSAVLQPAQPAQ